MKTEMLTVRKAGNCNDDGETSHCDSGRAVLSLVNL